MNPRIFREYDIRGVAERDFSPENCRAIGRAIGTLARSRGARRISLGRDCRLHSERIRDEVCQGLVSKGLEVLDIGICPTPLLYFSVNHWDLDGGVMVTASHNPAPDNGFKICIGKQTIHGEDIQEIYRLAEAGDFQNVPGGSVEERPILDEYLERILGEIQTPRKLKIAIDAGNGPGGLTALPLFRALGHEIVELYCEPDGRFPNHHPDPTVPENLADLIEVVRREHCDLGLAYDGDADRLGVIDENGEIVWGDRLMILLSRAILDERGSGTFIADVKCSQTLYDLVPQYGGRMVMWKTGHSLIKKKMREENALLAGEMSGHIFFADRWYGFDDAVYASARLVEIVSQRNLGVGELLADVPPSVATPEIRVDCPDEHKFEIVEALKAHFAKTHETIEIDGTRVLFEGGWGLVRASNTGPVLVLRFEAESETRLAEIRGDVEALVQEQIRLRAA